MVTISRNEVIDKSNQKLTITLSAGATPLVPAELHFAIFEINSGDKVLSPVKIFPTTLDKQPVDIFTDVASGGGKVTNGTYLAIFQMPHDASLGNTKIVWYYKTHPSQTSFTEFTEEFETIDFVDVYGSAGKPAVSLQEIRTFLRDKPEHHVLVDNFLFSNSDIMTAADQVVNWFNRLNPPLGSFSLGNFPDKYLLTLGISAWLFESEANRQLMEQLTYQDGNIHHGITDKTQLYRAAAAAMKQEFNSIAREIKMQININSIYTGEGMGIRFRYPGYYNKYYMD